MTRTRTRTSTSFTHGRSGYKNYACRCQTCREDHTVEMRELRGKRFALRVRVGDRLVAPMPASQHGNANTYGNHGCRCEPCTEANRQRECRRRWGW